MRGEERAFVFGKRLNILRRQKDISMDELALAVGSTKSAISRYESGSVTPTLDTAKRLADYFLVTVDWLSGGGNEGDALASVPQIYVDAVKYAIDRNVSAQQLKKAVDLIANKE